MKLSALPDLDKIVPVSVAVWSLDHGWYLMQWY